METIQQCIIRSGFQLPDDFYYRNSKNGNIGIESLTNIGDAEHFLSLDGAIAAKEELMRYFDAVNQCIDLYGNEFLFRHFSLDFSIYNSVTGRKLLDFPYHRSFNQLYEMLKYWMDEANNGKYFFRYNNKILEVYRDREYIYFSKYQRLVSSEEEPEVEQNKTNTAELPPPLETITFSDGCKGIPLIAFRTPARAFLNIFWHELFRTENFCRQISKEYGVYENIWTNRRLFPQEIDQLILSQNQLSCFLEVQNILDHSEEGKYFTPSRKAALISGVLKKGTIYTGEEVICLNSCYKEAFRCMVETIEQPPLGSIPEASLQVVSEVGNDRFALEIKGKSKKDFESVFYICKM